MLKSEYKKAVLVNLRTLQESGDTESAHEEADGWLCAFLIELGHEDVVLEYRKIDKWYA